MATKQQVEDARREGYERGRRDSETATVDSAKELQTLPGLEGCTSWFGYHMGIRIKVSTWRYPKGLVGYETDFRWAYYLILLAQQIPEDLRDELVQDGVPENDRRWSPWARSMDWHGGLSKHDVTGYVVTLGADYGHLYDEPGRDIDLKHVAYDARKTVESLLADRPDFLRRCDQCGKYTTKDLLREIQPAGDFIRVRCSNH